MSAAAGVRIERDGRVAVVVIDSPPVNALSHAERVGLSEAITLLGEDASVDGIVIHGAGRHFVSGADVREFDAGPAPPLLHDVLGRLEALTKPVVAALHGTTLGGGAELALACHARIAARDLSFGLPELALGLIPGSGGTARLPRLTGLGFALQLILGGRPIDAAEALRVGIVDALVDGDIRAAAVDHAHALAGTGASPRRTSALDLPGGDTATDLAAARATLTVAQRRSTAVAGLLVALEAGATLPFPAALARAREVFAECRTSRQSQALRHLFFAERAAAPVARGSDVAAIGVIGGGTMGGGIALSALQAGYAVTLVDAKTEAVVAAEARIHAHLAEQCRKGRLSAEQSAQAVARLTTATSLAALHAADLVIEAVFESLEVKQAVFAELGRLCRPGAVLATNTSTLDVDAIAAAGGRPADTVGMHFFSPANVMRLVEIVRGRASSAASLATALAATRRLGKIGVVVGNCYGFVGNRMLYAYGREKELMLLEGAAPERIDQVLEQFGMAMGPNAVGDLAGLDIGFHARRAWAERPDDPRFYRASDLLAELGRFGQKTGRGFYRYEAGQRRGVPDPEVSMLLGAEAARLGVAPRDIGDAEIVDRCILALVNEGARILGEGIVASAADIDVIWCNGYGFPRERGGPMFHADTLGAATVLARLHALAQAHGARYWQPAPLIEALAATGGRFGDVARSTEEHP